MALRQTIPNTDCTGGFYGDCRDDEAPADGAYQEGAGRIHLDHFVFGGFPALFRGDWGMGLLLTLLAFFTGNISSIIAAFLYNKSYTSKLIEKGYVFADTEALNSLVRAKLGVDTAAAVPNPT